jgi:hypothetical protein
MDPFRHSRFLVAAMLLGACAAVRAANVQVDFTDPSRFTDVGRELGGERDDTREGIRRHLQQAAGRLLPADEQLLVTVTDVDRAGSYEQSQRYSREVRVVRRTYPPRIDLDFRLVREGAVVKEGHRSLRDTSFNESLRYRDDALAYEKRMLDDWLRHEFQREETTAR